MFVKKKCKLIQRKNYIKVICCYVFQIITVLALKRKIPQKDQTDMKFLKLSWKWMPSSDLMHIYSLHYINLIIKPNKKNVLCVRGNSI